MNMLTLLSSLLFLTFSHEQGEKDAASTEIVARFLSKTKLTGKNDGEVQRDASQIPNSVTTRGTHAKPVTRTPFPCGGRNQQTRKTIG